MMFREVETKTKGTLYLHSMPGRYDTMTECIDALKEREIALIVRLTGDEEVAQKSPDYLYAIQSGRIPVEQAVFSVPDFGVPVNVDEFYKLAAEVDRRLKDGVNILVMDLSF